MTPEVNDITQGFRAATQIPVVAGEYKSNVPALANLGVNNNLAYTYHEGMRIYCIEERERYEWREVQGLEEGLLEENFIYPDDWFCFGVDYSLRAFNFFLEVTASQVAMSSVGEAGAVDVYNGFNPVSSNYEFSKIKSAHFQVTKDVNKTIFIEPNARDGVFYEEIDDIEFLVKTDKEINIYGYLPLYDNTNTQWTMPGLEESPKGTLVYIYNFTEGAGGSDIDITGTFKKFNILMYNIKIDQNLNYLKLVNDGDAWRILEQSNFV